MLRVSRLHQQISHQLSSHSVVARTASAIASSVGLLVLIGWWLNQKFLTSFLSFGMGSMEVDAAFCFFLSGISLWLSLTGKEQTEEKIAPSILSKVCAIAVLIIALFRVSQYVFHWNFGIDTMYHEFLNGLGIIHWEGMGINTALNFIVLGRALELVCQPKTRRSYWYAQVFTLIAALISLQAITGYAYGVSILYSFQAHDSGMALNTALTFTVLCIGILHAYPEQGLMRLITSDTYSGVLARRLLLAAIAVPLVLGWLTLQGLRAGLYEPEFAVSLLVVVLIVSFCVFIWESATALEKLGKQRDLAKEALKVNEEKLSSFVDSNVIGILFGDIHGRVRKANDEFLRMIGYTREDLEADKIKWTDITPPEYLPLDAEGIAEAIAKGACTPYEKEYICKDGSRIPVVVGYTLVGDNREESVAFILDLSARKQVEQALRQSEERFRLALDNIPDVFAIYNAQRQLEFVNAEALQRIKKPREEIIGRTDEEIFPPEVTEPYLSTLIQAQETRTIQKIEVTINLPDYGQFTTEIKYLPLLHKNGEIEQILAFTNDTTERKQVEETLRNQQKWLEDLLNLMPMPMLLIEPGTAKVTFANIAADKVAGGKFPKAESLADYNTYYYATDAAGNPIPAEEAPGVRVARGDRIEGFELDWHTPVGIRSLLIFADTLPAMHGYPATCVLMFQDISNLKQVEKALSLGYKRLQLLFGTASDLLSSQQPVALIDSLFKKLSKQIRLDVYFNYLVYEDKQILQLASYTGVSEEQVKEIEWLEFDRGVSGTVSQQRHPIALENLQQLTDKKTEFLRSIGITAYYSYPLIAQGKLLGTLAFGSRTRVKFSQNELGMMQAVCDQIAIAMERAKLIASLQQQTEQLKQANRMKDEFLAILSHELRSPLNAILGWTQLLRSRRQLDETKVAKALETIERNARAQTQLIEDLLDISRMIRGKLRLNVHPCNLAPIIEAALETVRLAAEIKEIDLKFCIMEDRGQGTGDWEDNNKLLNQTSCLNITGALNDETRNKALNSQSPAPSAPIPVIGDSERLQQIIWNLLSNAIKFTPQGGRVEVRLSVVKHKESLLHTNSQFPFPYAQIQVSDTGIGISPDFLPYVFDRFRQADSSTTRSYGGLGLGLAIVSHLVELHGGTIHVESPGEGQGTTFTVKLPLLGKKEEEDKETRGTSTAPPSLLGIRVLVVDDEADARDFLSIVLQQCQAEVKAIGSVQEALEVIAQWRPDVLVSDIGMPNEDGYTLIRKVRSLERTGEIPLSEHGTKIPAAALTAYARTEDRLRALQEGFQIHLPKPVEPAELATVVASLAGRT
ncbi:PAS domain S-box protein [Scytonema sp. UIC 10036]|uniref:ATP-binding protein n=1 Tax=Scytonema sp. UIC 10036 TaxID=2304196 RepID=UPI0012DA7E07|nr:ATP-binding protein [Scytonema sp. UIC 10036]MUG93716.1 PAS domain S-box protein [Scytonema sp. UIC 10036]